MNPRARAGRTGKELDALKRLIEGHFSDTTFLESQKPGQAFREVEDRGSEFDIILAVGGDGTINEVVAALAALAQETEAPVLAVLPLGTGNDFARTLGLSRVPRKALVQLQTALKVRIDTGTVTWEESGNSHRHVFVNVVGVGLDALIAHMVHRQPAYKKLPRGIGYSAAILASLWAWESPHVEVTTLESPPGLLYSGPLMFATTGNGRFSGGGYCINPQARLRDGLIDACIVKGLSLPRALRLLPRVRSGLHVGQDDILYRHVEGIRIRSRVPLPIHCDGEVPSQAASDITIRVVPASLDVLVPAPCVAWI